jgi:hypothetical protein
LIEAATPGQRHSAHGFLVIRFFFWKKLERFSPSLASSPEHLRVLFAARNVGLNVLGAGCRKLAAVAGS